MATAKTPRRTAAAVAVTAASTPADDASLPKFPRVMKLVNDTAQSWVIGRTHAAPASSVPINVRDEDALKRHRTDCLHILALSDHYKPVEPKEGETAKPHALRIVEADDEDADEDADGDDTAGGDTTA